MRIRSTDTLLGFPILELRRLMRRLGARDVLDVETVRRILSISRPAAKRLVTALDRAGYVETAESPVPGSPCWRLTAQGGALAMASAASPIRRATADRALAALLDRIDAVNADKGLRYRVAEAVVFGSYLGDEPTLGDVDVGIRLESRLPPDADIRAHRKGRVALAKKSGRVFRSWFDMVLWPEREVWLRLKARSRALSIHDMAQDAIFDREDLEFQVIYANGRRSPSSGRARRASTAR